MGPKAAFLSPPSVSGLTSIRSPSTTRAATVLAALRCGTNVGACARRPLAKGHGTCALKLSPSSWSAPLLSPPRALIVAASSEGEGEEEGLEATEGSMVSFHYLGKVVSSGTTIQTTWDREDGPMEYILGQMAEPSTGPERIMLAMDRALIGTREGTMKTIKLTAAEAYGELRADLIRVIPMEDMKANAPGSETMSKGDNLMLPNGLKGKVADISETSMTIDFNHPLAGEEVEFELTVMEVRELQEKAEVSHILVETEFEANRIKLEVAAGVDFEELAAKNSTCGSRSTGGLLGTVTPGQLVPSFDEVVWSAEVGTVQGPVQTVYGWHVVLVHDRVVPRP